MRGKFYAIVIVAAFSIAAVWTPDASAQYFRGRACPSSSYSAPVYDAPATSGNSGYGSSGSFTPFASNYLYPRFAYASAYLPALGYGNYGGFAPGNGGDRTGYNGGSGR
jgi:hypothetical protein